MALGQQLPLGRSFCLHRLFTQPLVFFLLLFFLLFLIFDGVEGGREGGREGGQAEYAKKKALAEMLASKVWEERQQKPVVVMPDGGGEELVGRERGEMERALEEKRREASEAARAFELKHAFYPRSKELKEQEEREAARQQKEMGEEEKEAFEMATKAKTELLEVQVGR